MIHGTSSRCKGLKDLLGMPYHDDTIWLVCCKIKLVVLWTIVLCCRGLERTYLWRKAFILESLISSNVYGVFSCLLDPYKHRAGKLACGMSIPFSMVFTKG